MLQFNDGHLNFTTYTGRVYYSSNGTAGPFTPAATTFNPPFSLFGTARFFSFSSVTALHNNPNVVFRIYLWSTAGNAGQLVRFRNIAVGADPTMTEVTAVDSRTLDVEFSKAMGASALNAANYTVSGPGKGTTANNPATVTLTGGLYRLQWNSPQEFRNGQTVTVTGSNSIRDTSNIPLGSLNSASTTAIGVAPTAVSIVPDQPTPTAASTINFTVNFSEAVDGQDSAGPPFDNYAIQLISGSLSGVAVTNVTAGPGASHVVTVSTGTGTGTFRLRLSAAGAIADLAGNPFTGTLNGPNVQMLRTLPVVTAITSAAPSPTNAGSVTYDITFDRDVFNVDTTGPVYSNFGPTVVSGTLSGATITNLTGSGASYTATVSTGTGDGELRLDLTSIGAIVDALNNPLGNFFNSGTVVTIDRTGPSVASIVPVGPTLTNAQSVDFLVTFSESVTGVDLTGPDFDGFAAVGDGSITSATISAVFGAADSYTLTVDTGSGDGTLRVDAATMAGVADLAGNAMASGLSPGGAVTIDKTAPQMIELLAMTASPTNAATVEFLATFSEPISGMDMAGPDFDNFAAAIHSGTLSGAAVTAVDGIDTTFTITLSTGSGEGALTADFHAAGTVQDAAGNTAIAPVMGSETIHIDHVAPSVAALTPAPGQPDPAVALPVYFQVTFTESVFDFSLDDFGVGASTAPGAAVVSMTPSFDGSAGPYTIEVTASGEGAITLDLSALAATDEAGNAAAVFVGSATVSYSQGLSVRDWQLSD